MKNKIFKTVADIIVDTTGNNLDDIKLESSLRQDLGFDSLDEVEFVMALESEYGIDINDEEAAKLKTVQDVVSIVEEMMP